MVDTIKNKWMLSAIIAEVLALIAAIGTIPVLQFPVPVAWMLSATAILSACGSSHRDGVFSDAVQSKAVERGAEGRDRGNAWSVHAQR